jgi:hypothetical protein
MARAYDIAVAALAIDADRKWLDNLTSQHTIPGTEHLARGVARRLTLHALVIAAIVRDLNQLLGVPVARGVALSTELLDQVDRDSSSAALAGEYPASPDGTPVVELGENIELRIDVAGVQRRIETKLLDAMERVVPRRRGRPPRKERRGTR